MNLYYIGEQLEEVCKLMLVAFGILKLSVRGKKRENLLWIFLLALVMVMGNSYFREWFGNEFDLERKIVMLYIWFCLSCDERLGYKSGIYLFMVATVNVIDVLLAEIVVVVSNISMSEIVQNPIDRLLTNGMSIVCFSVAVILLRKRKIAKIPLSYLGIIGMAIFGAGLLLGSCQGIALGYGEKMQKFLYLMCGICCALLVFLSILLVYVIHSRKYYKQLCYLHAKYQDLQKQHYMEVYEKMQELRTFRHDFRHHIQCMQHWCREDNKEQLYAYIAQLGEFQTEHAMLHTGNQMADAVVSYFSSVIKEKEIHMEWIGVLPEDICMEMVEFCSLLSNAMENAIEACQRVEKGKRYIEVEVQHSESYLYIDIQNSRKEFAGRDADLKTTKSDKRNHGFGTESMKKVVEKYGGSIVWIGEKTEMRVEIELPNTIEEE